MGLFATGVGLVTAQAGGRMHGMTANSITSVSLDPLLVLVCVGKRARLVPLLRESGCFAVNFLTREQELVARHFAGQGYRGAPPDVHFEPWRGGPRLRGCLATLGCRIAQFVDAGDHWVVIGQVIALAEGASEAEPLLYYRGRYRRLAPVEELVVREAPDLLTGAGAALYYDDAGEPEPPFDWA
jgi:flavin reductase (DIM6/NTAB) family NADH-FMN oxidoreductase RutF